VGEFDEAGEVLVVDVATARRARLVRACWALIDSICWFAAMVSTVWLRYDFVIPARALPLVLITGAVGAACQIALGTLLGPYRTGHDRGSYEETSDLGRATILATLVTFGLVSLWHPDYLPRSAPVTGGALALLAMFAARLMVRSTHTRAARGRQGAEPVIVFGAGRGGSRLVRSALREDDSPILPVALLDDDPAKSRLRIEGVRVRGTRADLVRVADQTGATTLVLAAPTMDAEIARELTATAADAGMAVKVLPSMAEIIDGRPTDSLRDLDLADLLGRHPAHLDAAVISQSLAGRRVLVTGAGGSIGSELCRQIARFDPDVLFLLDRDESALHATSLSLDGDGLLGGDSVLLADIRDPGALHATFTHARPDVVFHAAALKHLPLLERFPDEAWKTNVLGTLNVLRAAAEVGVETFVNVSTDKAADPTSTLGYSKRLTERLTAEFARRYPGRFVSVRFGNVLGSRGSVVPAFAAQIERGGPVTVTHPEVKRYFMLIPEACQLVLQAAAIGADGDVLVLDMGEQIRIADVARTLIQISGRQDVDIVYTGLRPGEKLGEDLFSDAESRRPTSHELVARVGVPALDVSEVAGRIFDSPEDARDWMRTTSRLWTTPLADPSPITVVHRDLSPGVRPADADAPDDEDEMRDVRNHSRAAEAPEDHRAPLPSRAQETS